MSRALVLAAALALAAGAAGPATISNPLLPSGADPFVARDGDTYYYLDTEGRRIAIRRTRDLSRLAEAENHVVWTPPASGPNARSIWAPELHRVGDRWFLYYTAAASGHDDDAHRGIFVLENAAADPTTGQWVDRGRVNTRLPGIDATVFAYRGRRYLVYSAYDGPDSVLAIARMANPWTLEPGEVVIARPDRAWERQGGRQILEGPAFLAGPRGDLFLSYSGSACWSDDYAIGLLRARPGSDPLDPAAWTKAPGPVLAKSPAAGIYATGHNGFFTGPGGRGNWIIFHANPGPGMGCGRRRSPRIAQVKWTVRGLPVFAAPVRDGLPMPAPGAGR